jgi:valyl-tRNA synthetase
VYEPIHLIYDFTWNILADHYIEAVKARAYNDGNRYSVEEQRGAWYTLHRALDMILKALAPIMPFFTDYLWRSIKGRSIHLERFPEPPKEWESWDDEPLEALMRIDSAIWKYKKERGMRLSDRLEAIVYVDNPKAKSIKQEIVDLHRVRAVEIGKPGDGAEEIAPGIWVKRV